MESILFYLILSSLVVHQTSSGNTFYNQFSKSVERKIRDAPVSRDNQHELRTIEALLSSIDMKFKKVDSLDIIYRSSIEQMSKKLDTLNQRVNDNGDNVNALLNAIRALDNKLVFLGNNKPNAENLNSKLHDLTSKIEGLNNNLVQLKNEVIERKPNNRDLYMQGSERRHIVAIPDGKAFQSIQEGKMDKEMEIMKANLRNLDNKMQNQMEKITSSISKLLQNVVELKDAIMDPTDSGFMQPDLQSPEFNNSSNNRTATTYLQLTKFEWLFRKLRPHLQIAERLDDIYTTMMGNRRSIEDTKIKSERLLSHSFHTTQALNDVKNDIYFQTNKIMENLNQVEQWLKEQQIGAASNLDPKFLQAGLKELLDKVDEDEKEKVSQQLPEEFIEIHKPGGEFAKFTDALPDNIEVITGTETHPLVSNITRAPINYSYANICPFQEHPGINCADLKNKGVNQSGVYYILIKGTTYWFMKVYCEMEVAGGGWTVIQRRDEFDEVHESFNRDWNEYKNGFGDLTKEFWLGNENIFMLTNQEEYTLRIDMEDFDGNKRYAEYSKFKLASEAENYKLEIGGYDGTAGDSLNDPWYGSNISPFSTYNRDNDRSSLNCASMLRGGWWWRSCGRGLNGLYLTDPNDLAARQGIVWFRWRGWDYTLKRAQMMIRPKEFEPLEQQNRTEDKENVSTTENNKESHTSATS